MWYIILNDFCVLDYPCFERINPTWLWCIIFLYVASIYFASILLKIFASIFIRYWSVVFLWCLCLALVSGSYWLHRMSQKGFLDFYRQHLMAGCLPGIGSWASCLRSAAASTRGRWQASPRMALPSPCTSQLSLATRLAWPMLWERLIDQGPKCIRKKLWRLWP